MNLRGLVSVSGKPGLYRVIGQNKSGFVLESLDAQKVKLVVNLTTSKIASLEDITVFGENEDLKLVDIFTKIKESASIPDAKADGKVLRSFFREVAPDHDEEKVYASDMKKIITWYNLIKDLPLFNEDASVSNGEATAEELTEEPVAVQEEEDEKPVKKTAKKAAKKAE